MLAEKINPLVRVETLLTELLTETKKMAKSKSRNSGVFEPRWLKTVNAAAWCDYPVDTFRELAKEFQIPRHGPKLNRYDKEEIDQWMKDPLCFRNNTKPMVKSGASYKPKMVRHLTSYISSGIRNKRRG